jgi:hypothetical protein
MYYIKKYFGIYKYRNSGIDKYIDISNLNVKKNR